MAETVAKPKTFMDQWKLEPCQCIHCGRILKSYFSKNSHLKYCEKRILPRYYKIKDLLFIIFSNPRRRRALALQKLIHDTPDPKLFIGTLNFLKNAKEIDRYVVVKLENSPALVEYIDGQIPFMIIRNKLSPAEFETFQKTAAKKEEV